MLLRLADEARRGVLLSPRRRVLLPLSQPRPPPSALEPAASMSDNTIVLYVLLTTASRRAASLTRSLIPLAGTRYRTTRSGASGARPGFIPRRDGRAR